MAPICGIEADTLARGRARLRPRRERDHLLGHGRVAAHPRHRQRALPDRAGADHRPDRPSRHGAASAARPEQRAGRLRRRPDPDVLPRLQVGREPGNPRPSTRRPGASSCRRSAARPWSRSWTRSTPTRSRACTSRARTRRCRTPISTTPARRWRISSISWCRTCSSPRPRSTPTSSCRPPAGRRRTAPSPTPTARCRWAARRCRCRATRARISGSSRRSPTAWAAAGTTSTSARCSPRWRR